MKLYRFNFSVAGPLLEAVQMSRLFRDSKTFVDKKLKFPPGKIIKNFQDLLARQNGGPLSLDQVKLVNMILSYSGKAVGVVASDARVTVAQLNIQKK